MLYVEHLNEAENTSLNREDVGVTHMGVAHLVEEVFTMDGVSALAQSECTHHGHQDKADGKVLCAMQEVSCHPAIDVVGVLECALPLWLKTPSLPCV